MSRRIVSRKALDAALPVARARGKVSLFQREPGTSCHFLINGGGHDAMVYAKRTRSLYGTLEDIEAEHAELLAYLRNVRPAPGTDVELWFWNPYGAMRFFCIKPATLIELDRHGVAFAVPAARSRRRSFRSDGEKTGAAGPRDSVKMPEKSGLPEKMPEDGVSGASENPGPAKNSLPAEPGPAAGDPGPGTESGPVDPTPGARSPEPPLLAGLAGPVDKPHEPEPAATGRG